MIKKYKIKFKYDELLKQEHSYNLYACLLEKVDRNVGELYHKNEITPISQYLEIKNNEIYWHITLFKEAISIFDEIINNQVMWSIDKTKLFVEEIEQEHIKNVEELFKMAKTIKIDTIIFKSPTAFKSKGNYQILPSIKLVFQSSMKKWNSIFADCQIEDLDGEGLESIINGIIITEYSLKSTKYRIKNQNIPSFTGSISYKNNLTGFHYELSKVLLIFAKYSGVGIKSTLGMGAIQ